VCVQGTLIKYTGASVTFGTNSVDVLVSSTWSANLPNMLVCEKHAGNGVAAGSGTATDCRHPDCEIVYDLVAVPFAIEPHVLPQLTECSGSVHLE